MHDFPLFWWSPHSSLSPVLVSMETGRGVENPEASVWLKDSSYVSPAISTLIFFNRAIYRNGTSSRTNVKYQLKNVKRLFQSRCSELSDLKCVTLEHKEISLKQVFPKIIAGD